MFIIMSNQNNGLLTKVWGPPLWEAFHSITFGYPVEPDDNKKIEYRKMIESLADVLPCVYCRKSYKEFISEGKNRLTDADLVSRDAFCRWGYRLHNRVNEKLGVDYGVTYEEVVEKYESYRAKCVSKDRGCTMPISLKAQSYVKAKIRHAPVAKLDFCKKFTKYAIGRGFKGYARELDEYDRVMNSGDRGDRDVACRRIIDYMRLNSIDCTENDGEFKGLPTRHELALMSMRSGNISTHHHKEIIQKLNEWEYRQ